MGWRSECDARRPTDRRRHRINRAISGSTGNVQPVRTDPTHINCIRLYRCYTVFVSVPFLSSFSASPVAIQFHPTPTSPIASMWSLAHACRRANVATKAARCITTAIRANVATTQATRIAQPNNIANRTGRLTEIDTAAAAMHNQNDHSEPANRTLTVVSFCVCVC